MVAKANFHMLAPGADNANYLKPLHLYDKRYFQIWKYVINYAWHVSESLEESGKSRTKPIGLPYTVLTFQALTQEEFQFFKYTFFEDTTLFDTPITIRTYDNYNNEWCNYNGTLKIPPDIDARWVSEEWRPIDFSIKKLKKIA